MGYGNEGGTTYAYIPIRQMGNGRRWSANITVGDSALVVLILVKTGTGKVSTRQIEIAKDGSWR